MSGVGELAKVGGIGSWHSSTVLVSQCLFQIQGFEPVYLSHFVKEEMGCGSVAYLGLVR